MHDGYQFVTQPPLRRGGPMPGRVLAKGTGDLGGIAALCVLAGAVTV
jgi:hypothetical protein